MLEDRCSLPRHSPQVSGIYVGFAGIDCLFEATHHYKLPRVRARCGAVVRREQSSILRLAQRAGNKHRTKLPKTSVLAASIVQLGYVIP